MAEDRFCPACGARTPAPGGGISAAPPTVSWSHFAERLRAATRDYEILAQLGRGGMAAVFLAHEPALKRRVAIKVMSPELMLGEGLVDRFRQEAQTVARLNHPNIVTIHAIRADGGLHYLVMEYLEGRTLEALIGQHGALPLDVALPILAQVGAALSYAHRHSVIHRDIKPGNIIVGSDGEAVVTDFGIAKVAESTTHTMPGEQIGTPAYMSPEQCEGRAVTAASDQYSFGVMAYELLVGRRPFLGANLVVMRAHSEAAPPPIRGLRPEIPEPFERAILKMLAKDPPERFGTMDQALAALGAESIRPSDPRVERIRGLVSATDETVTPLEASSSPSQESVRIEPVTPSSPPATTGSRHGRNLLIAFGAVLGAVVVAAVLLPSDEPPVPPPPAVSLANRIDGAGPGDTVVIPAGTHPIGTVRIDRPIVLLGAGDSTVVHLTGDTGLVFASPGSGMGRLTIRRDGSGPGPAVVLEAGGSAVLEEVRLEGPGVGASCGSVGHGVLVAGAGGHRVTRSTIRGFCSGVHLLADAAPTLTGNTVEANQSGIRYFGTQGGLASGNTIRGNETGVSVRAGRPSLDGNRIEGNRSFGIAWSPERSSPVGLLKNSFANNLGGDIEPKPRP